MENYKLGKILGDGTFGSVIKGIHVKSGQIVAIKKMKKRFFRWDECMKLQEISSLMSFHHPNIVRLFEIIKERNELFFVFEYMGQNIYQLLKEKKGPLIELTIRNIAFQTLQGLAFIHRKGFFHRDIKPENILELDGTIKIADFGLVKEATSRPPYTDYVSTRWYRAPEVILRSPKYGPEIDLFAVGAIIAELAMAYPLFPGTSEADQINKICKVLGCPKREDWEQGYRLANSIGFAFPYEQGQNLSELLPNSSKNLIDLCNELLQFNPNSRLTAQEAINHKFFDVGLREIGDSDEIKLYSNFSQLKNESKIENAVELKKIHSTPKNAKLKTKYYISKARYRPGVKPLNILETL